MRKEGVVVVKERGERMNKYQEALKTFAKVSYANGNVVNFRKSLEEVQEDYKVLEELVDKAMPKKRSWSIKNNGKTFDCCPVCKKTIKITYQYCPGCGQAIEVDV